MYTLVNVLSVTSISYHYNEYKRSDSFYQLEIYANTKKSTDTENVYIVVPLTMKKKHVYCFLASYPQNEVQYTKKFRKEVLKIVENYRKELLDEITKNALAQMTSGRCKENKNV